MGIFGKKYQWHSRELQRKDRLYGRLALVTMVLALVCLFILSAYVSWAIIMVIALLIIAMGFSVVSWRVQSKDKKLKEIMRRKA